MANHAKKSLSASPRWSRCPGSIREEEKYLNTSSSAASDGIGSHLLLELILSGERRAVRGGRFAKTTSYLNETIGLSHVEKPEGWVVDQLRLDRVMVAVDYVQRRLDVLAPDVLLLVEHKTNPGLKYGINDMWGTVDITLIGGSVLEVIDYKDGFTYVSENTEQLLAYADGQTEHAKQLFFNIKTVKKTIIQPKVEKDPIRSVTHSKKQNDEMAEKLAVAAKLTDDPDAPLIPGDHCKWCRHKLNCKARNQTAINTINGSVVPVEMTNEQLANANDVIPIINDFVNALEKEAEERIKLGQIVPGYEMAPGRKKNRVWTNEVLAERKLRLMTIGGRKLKHGEYVVKKLISPSMVLKFDLLPKQRALIINELTVREPGDEKLQKASAVNLLPVDEMFPEPVLPSEERIKGELEAIFHPKEKRVIVMTEKATGFTADEFREKSVYWTDELLVSLGYATWSEQ